MIHNKVIAIIDDDKVFQFTTAHLIKRKLAPERVLSFHDGSQAIEYLRDHLGKPTELPSIILLDINMPVMDGWGFLENLKELHQQLPNEVHLHVYMVSSSVDEQDINRAKSYDVVEDYIVKPIDPDTLRDKLDQHLGRLID